MIYYKVIFTKKIDRDNLRTILLDTMCELITESWGKFPEEFIAKHVLSSDIIALAYSGDTLIGFCATTYKNILNKKIIYIEFTIVKPEHQHSLFGTKLTIKALKKIIGWKVLLSFFKPLEVMLITPNIRVLGKIAKIIPNTYPNPFKLDPTTNRISEADEETWSLAKALIKSSDDPNRKIDREALVLHDSYKTTPWLIFNDEKIPWHKDEILNKFAKQYLGYGKNEDKEFIVRSTVGFKDLIKLIL